MIYPKTYETLLLLPNQFFEIEGSQYQIVDQLRESNGVHQETTYSFKRIPDTTGKRWEMSHDRVDELERKKRITFK